MGNAPAPTPSSGTIPPPIPRSSWARSGGCGRLCTRAESVRITVPGSYVLVEAILSAIDDYARARDRQQRILLESTAQRRLTQRYPRRSRWAGELLDESLTRLCCPAMTAVCGELWLASTFLIQQREAQTASARRSAAASSWPADCGSGAEDISNPRTATNHVPFLFNPLLGAEP
jgi:hypothetical protein